MMPPALPMLRKNWPKIALAVLVIAGIAALYSRIDVHRVHDYFQSWPGWALFLAIVILPLLGFPVTVLHVIAGMRWGPRWGIAIVAIAILLQLFASYALVSLFRRPFERQFAKLRARLPQTAHGPMTLFTLLLPGVPFFAKNYVLPIAGVPLGTYLMWAFPIHTLRSSIAVIFGHESDQLTPWRIAGFAAYAVAITLSFAWAFRRLRAAVGDRPPAANGPMPPA
jgi:uncharacterized membrane protein YdjX (TVP38/TMEM64 family)